MKTLSEHDWGLINGYADGELSAEDEAMIARRLIHDAALAAALARVHATKAGLSLLRPASAPAEPPRRSRLGRFALAASLAALIVSGAAYQLGGFGESWQDAPAELHATLSSNTYVLPESPVLPVISTARIGDVQVFDLTSSRLFLVDVQSTREAERDVVAMHYRGRNGCRLTVVALEALAGDPPTLPLHHDGPGARWTTGGIHFYLLAGGMDRDRFDAITAYAMAESERLHSQQRLRLAMGTATDQAQPCA